MFLWKISRLLHLLLQFRQSLITSQRCSPEELKWCVLLLQQPVTWPSITWYIPQALVTPDCFAPKVTELSEYNGMGCSSYFVRTITAVATFRFQNVNIIVQRRKLRLMAALSFARWRHSSKLSWYTLLHTCCMFVAKYSCIILAFFPTNDYCAYSLFVTINCINVPRMKTSHQL